MSRNLRPLSEEEHQALGPSLKAQHDAAVDLYCRLTNAYGLKSKPANAAWKQVRALETLRSVLDGIHYRQHLERTGEPMGFDCYYPRGEENTPNPTTEPQSEAAPSR